MRALVVDSTVVGRLALHDVPEPIVESRDALVEVRAFSLNRGEWRAARAAADGARLGWDFAGILRSPIDERLTVGSRVVGASAGRSWATRVAVPRDWVAPLPDDVSFSQAAALPTAGLTALRTLRLGQAILGRRVLITGAAGGVGRFAVQLARLGGAQVTALVSPNSPHAKLLTELGAAVVATDTAQLDGRFDLILESVGGDLLADVVKRLDPDGTLVMFGNSSNGVTSLNVRELYLNACIRIQGFELFHNPQPFGRDLDYLARLVADGRLDPQVGNELSWDRISEALHILDGHSASGKVVLTVS